MIHQKWVHESFSSFCNDHDCQGVLGVEGLGALEHLRYLAAFECKGGYPHGKT